MPPWGEVKTGHGHRPARIKTIFSAHAPVGLLEMLGDADVADLVDVGLKKPHAKKMLKSLAGYTKGI